VPILPGIHPGAGDCVLLLHSRRADRHATDELPELRGAERCGGRPIGLDLRPMRYVVVLEKVGVTIQP
jgi:hypothetical protein